MGRDALEGIHDCRRVGWESCDAPFCDCQRQNMEDALDEPVRRILTYEEMKEMWKRIDKKKLDKQLKD